MNTESKPRFVFVNYISRSGSTLLCKLLNEYQGVSVGIEAGFPGSTKKMISDEFRVIKNLDQLNHYLDILFNDIRFKEWRLDLTEVSTRIANNGFPVGFKNILETLFNEYFKDDEPAEIYIHKAGYYIDALEEVINEFKDSKNIYITRDPRAIYNSQKNADCLYSGKKMGDNFIHFIYQYKRRVKTAQSTDVDKLLTIKYEDLIDNPEKIVGKVLSYIGIENAIRKENANDYSKRIPENQKSLHTNVGSEPNTKSLSKWVGNLSLPELYLIQRNLSNEMDALGYEKNKLPFMSARQMLSYIGMCTKYNYYAFRRNTKRLCHDLQ